MRVSVLNRDLSSCLFTLETKFTVEPTSGPHSSLVPGVSLRVHLADLELPFFFFVSIICEVSQPFFRLGILKLLNTYPIFVSA